MLVLKKLIVSLIGKIGIASLIGKIVIINLIGCLFQLIIQVKSCQEFLPPLSNPYTYDNIGIDYTKLETGQYCNILCGNNHTSLPYQPYNIGPDNYFCIGQYKKLITNADGTFDVKSIYICRPLNYQNSYYFTQVQYDYFSYGNYYYPNGTSIQIQVFYALQCLYSYCNSTCRQCKHTSLYSNQCSYCVSNYITYTDQLLNPQCNVASSSKFQYLFNINRQSRIGDFGYLTSVTYNYSQEITLNQIGQPLANNLYINQTISVKYGSNNITFGLSNLPKHFSILVRFKAMSTLSNVNSRYFKIIVSNSTQNQLLSSIQPLDKTMEPTQKKFTHSLSTLSLTFAFDIDCLCTFQDISLYYQKCPDYCQNSCPDGIYALDNITGQCLTSMIGYKIVDYQFVNLRLCASYCDQCADTSFYQCISCLSQHLQYDNALTSLQIPGSCNLSSSTPYEYYTYFDCHTPRNFTFFQSGFFINYYGAIVEQYYSFLSSLNFSLCIDRYDNNGDVIDFEYFSPNWFSISLQNLSNHIELMVRVRAYTQCIYSSVAGNGQNTTLTLKANNIAVSKDIIVQNSSIIVENLISHNSSTLNITVFFGNSSEKCKKLVSRLVIYIKKCEDYCPKDCPSAGIYYQHPSIASKCISACPAGYVQTYPSCTKFEFCSSTCNACSDNLLQSSCTSCSSSYLTYQTFNPSSPSNCLPLSSSEFQYLYTIKNDTQLQSTIVQSVTFNTTIVESTASKVLSQFMYSGNVIQFTKFSSNLIKITLGNLINHSYLIVRIRVFTFCSASKSQNTQFNLSIGGNQSSVFTIGTNLSSVVEHKANHSTSSVDLLLNFGDVSQACKKTVQDMSIYYKKCQDFCVTNTCPDTLPYYKHPSQNICVNKCPYGYKQSGSSCILFSMCNSTCTNCLSKLLSNQCSSCVSDYLTLPSPTLVLNSCQIQPLFKYQLLYTISKTTALNTTIVRSVRYNATSVMEQLNGKLLSSFLYLSNVIEFAVLSSSTVTFELQNLPAIHKQILFRIRLYTECALTNGQNLTLTLVVDSEPSQLPFTKNITTANVQTTAEAQFDHTDSDMTFSLSFGNSSQTCKKMVQDISIYYSKCANYCNSSDCPETEPYYKHNALEKCVNTCPDGYTEVGHYCQAFQFCNSTCKQCAGNLSSLQCTSCISDYLSYDQYDLSPASSCHILPNFRCSLFYTITKDTLLSFNGYIQNITINETVTLSGLSNKLLSSVLYIGNVIQFLSLSSSTVQFNLKNLTPHKSILIRARVYTLCSTLNGENTTISLILDSDYSSIKYKQLIASTSDIVQNFKYHNETTINFMISFGDVSEMCKKMVQDVNVFYGQCQQYCGSNFCPVSQPYYKHPTEQYCVSLCPLGYRSSGHYCVPFTLCDSTCDTCLLKYNATQCTACQSQYLNYLFPDKEVALPSIDYPNQCQPQRQYLFRYLFSINRSTILEDSYVKNITFNDTLYDYDGQPLSKSIYSGFIIDFSTFNTTKIEFNIDGLPTHVKLIVRLRALTQCSQQFGQNTTLILMLAGQSAASSKAKNSQIPDEQYIVENLFNHTDENLFIRVQFGTYFETCRKVIQDLSVYIQKCQSYCISSDCPEYKPYYKHPLVDKCVDSCPIGYVESGNTGGLCTKLEYCNSTCAQCTVKLNSSRCGTCQSNILKYQNFGYGILQGGCDPLGDQSWRLYTVIDKDTRIKASKLNRVIYNTNITINGRDIILSAFIYTFNVIQITSFSDNVLMFELYEIPLNLTLMFRIRVFTLCSGNTNSSNNGQNNTLTVEYDNNTKSVNVPPLKEYIFQSTAFLPTESPFMITLTFGAKSQTCRKIIQDFSFYNMICPFYCNKCPNEGQIKQLYSTTCLNTCNKGEYISNDTSTRIISCKKCSKQCIECSKIQNNCTVCGVVENQIYFINFKNISVINSQDNSEQTLLFGMCQTSCQGEYYKNKQTFTCEPCNVNCQKCQQLPNNCTKCKSAGGVDYFLQPNYNICLNQCPKGYYGDKGSFTCALCDSRCTLCTGHANNSCSKCQKNKKNVSHYLIPRSTNCSNVCPDNYYGQQKTFTCQKCDDKCKTCTKSPKHCTSCYTIAQSTYIYFYNNSCSENCSQVYYQFEGECLEACPQNTRFLLIIGYKVCIKCKNNSCIPPTFKFESKLSENGLFLVHNLSFSNNLSAQINNPVLVKQMLAVYVITKQNIFEQSIVASNTRQLQIKQIKLSKKRSYIQVYTQNLGQKFNFDRTYIMIKFLENFLRDKIGIQYFPLSSETTINRLQYAKTYYNTHQLSVLIIIGSCACVVSFCYLIWSIIITDVKISKGYHEIMQFIMFIQCLGLLRTRLFDFPNGNYFHLLRGFAGYEFLWLQNLIAPLITGTKETYSLPVQNQLTQFGFGSGDFFYLVGSSIQVYGALQVLLLIAMIIFKARKSLRNLQRCYIIQNTIVSLLLTKVLFTSLTILFHLYLNRDYFQELSIDFWVSVEWAVGVILFYLIYFIFWVYNNLRHKLYEVHNVVRVFVIFFSLIDSSFLACFILNIIEIIISVIDFKIYQKWKINQTSYIVEKCLILATFNTVMWIENLILLCVLLGLQIIGLIILKGYQIYKWRKQLQRSVSYHWEEEIFNGAVEIESGQSNMVLSEENAQITRIRRQLNNQRESKNKRLQKRRIENFPQDMQLEWKAENQE